MAKGKGETLNEQSLFSSANVDTPLGVAAVALAERFCGSLAVERRCWFHDHETVEILGGDASGAEGLFRCVRRGS